MMKFTNQDAKTIMNAIVAETYYCNAAFKYLDYDGGLQMISNSTVQFTRQDSLNDNCDCNVETLVDFSFFESLGLGKDLINKHKAKIKREIEQCGILSLGKTNDNETLWKGYSSDGSLGDVICVELDPKKLIDVLKKPLLQVHYFEDASQKIPVSLLFSGTDNVLQRLFFYKFYTTKFKWDLPHKKQWELEDELRFVDITIQEKPMNRIQVPINCFRNIYVKRTMDEDHVEGIISCAKGIPVTVL